MRERRWETQATLTFGEALAVSGQLAAQGLRPVASNKDVICYVEEWAVRAPEEFDALDPWSTEDVTLVHLREGWQGDFFLLAGAYHTVYQRHQSVGTYCSVSHPWQLSGPFARHYPRGMLWQGFRHTHGFIRVRLHTTEVVTPGETRADAWRGEWLDERRRAFLAAIKLLDVPIDVRNDNGQTILCSDDTSRPLFCSWPDAFGPCQFECNSPDAFEYLVPASRLAATCGGTPARVRAYLTGFSDEALNEFAAEAPGTRLSYRCSVHCPLGDVPEVLRAIAPAGRLYTTLCEFHTQQIWPGGADASAIIGIVGSDGGFQLEVRLNRAPLQEENMTGELERLLGMPVTYAPLLPFP
ncbi:MAG: hypothetical protein ACKOBZ_00070 [Nitrospira sp.]